MSWEERGEELYNLYCFSCIWILVCYLILMRRQEQTDFLQNMYFQKIIIVILINTKNKRIKAFVEINPLFGAFWIISMSFISDHTERKSIHFLNVSILYCLYEGCVFPVKLMPLCICTMYWTLFFPIVKLDH